MEDADQIVGHFRPGMSFRFQMIFESS
jgi:hypothetical protein